MYSIHTQGTNKGWSLETSKQTSINICAERGIEIMATLAKSAIVLMFNYSSFHIHTVVLAARAAKLNVIGSRLSSP